ncbi:MAG: transcriptional regulator [Candidatus Tectimicrobiota bacterium]|nr:MAG: transcriptional regulator [Candidatus Tectomicrobia bacterium]
MGTDFAKPAGQILRLLQERGPLSVKELETALGVTGTAVRQQLAPLLAEGVVAATVVRERRGRPHAVYRLTEKGQALFARGCEDLALALLEEVLALAEPQTLQQLLHRVSTRLGQQFAAQMGGAELAERLRRLLAWLEAHGIAGKVDEEGDTFVLTAYGCPYYGLARGHREVCEMETEAIQLALGSAVTLSRSQFDGHHGCQFRVSKVSPEA